ncbi:MAG TPA: DUF6171 family protein [Verrucomicrobiae bacterium]|jgi:hypothetical protein
MKIVHVGRLQRASTARKAGYLEAHQKIGRPVTIFGQPFLQLTDGDYAAIRREFALAPKSSVKSVVSLSGAIPTQKPKIGLGIKQKPADAKLPTFAVMAKNIVGAAGRVITAATAGQPVQVSDDMFQRRMKVCMACEFLDKASQRCGKCGCFVSAQVIGKARLATEKCPENKW